MKISIIIVLYNESSFIEGTLDALAGFSNHECDINIIISGQRFADENIDKIQNLKNKNYNIKLHYNKYNFNTPVIYTNNLLKSEYKDHDIVIGCSPDYRMTSKSSLDCFIDKASSLLTSKYTISCVEFARSNLRWACGIITPLGLEKVGFFDTNFTPMGMSDNDYHLRCLLDFKPDMPMSYYLDENNYLDAPYGESIVVPSCHLSYNANPECYNYIGISIPTYDYTNLLFRRTSDVLNQFYYTEKWGGLPGKEKFKLPFNSQSIKIPTTETPGLVGVRNVCSKI